jgi:hypothetical protein
MKPQCPNNCASEHQRPLELTELPQLCQRVRSEIAFLRGIAMVCEACSAVYVRCRIGTVPVDTLPGVGQSE